MSVLAVDAGTTAVTALLVGEDARVLGRGTAPASPDYPRPGWVEQDPEQLWTATLTACRAALAAAGPDAPPPRCLGLSNQRETAVLWRTGDLRPARPAIGWQDRRTAGVCERLRADGVEPDLAARTGLRLDPYFTAPKLAWLARHEPDTWAGVRSGSTAVGTVDSYLLARLTAGRLRATDPTNASRTLLYDLHRGGWSAELAALFEVPVHALAEVRPSTGPFGRTDPGAFLGLDLPVTGVAGDQQAALFGQGRFDPGDAKCTYGTGSFVLVTAGTTVPTAADGLLATVAWDLGDGPRYALEGSVFVTGAAVGWLQDGLGVLARPAEVEALAASVADSGGVVFVPALAGLGTPHWDPHARGAIFGLTRGTTAAHLARATLDAIVLQVRDVLEVVRERAGVTVGGLAVDGGAAGNDLLCQLQADLLGVPVERPAELESTALGAAFLAGVGAGVWSGPAEVRRARRVDRRFAPQRPPDPGLLARWRAAVSRCGGWAALG